VGVIGLGVRHIMIFMLSGNRLIVMIDEGLLENFGRAGTIGCWCGRRSDAID
jgi:hypothetical protein